MLFEYSNVFFVLHKTSINLFFQFLFDFMRYIFKKELSGQ